MLPYDGCRRAQLLGVPSGGHGGCNGIGKKSAGTTGQQQKRAKLLTLATSPNCPL